MPGINPSFLILENYCLGRCVPGREFKLVSASKPRGRHENIAENIKCIPKILAKNENFIFVFICVNLIEILIPTLVCAFQSLSLNLGWVEFREKVPKRLCRNYAVKKKACRNYAFI